MVQRRRACDTAPGLSFQDQLHLHRARMDSSLAANALTNRGKKKFILCFDGTGNKFSGTDEDSNILKIYRMLDRSDNDQFHYYQPGIGTYVVAKSLSHTSHLDRVKSWYAKAKDSAVGTSFAAHVMGGYRFLMRYYVPGDDIYLFGFSRGAYTARFLAEMLDHVGLLSAGNEEMCNFAWKTFKKWQCRQERNAEERKQKKFLLEYMCAFRETFSRPVKPIRFLGLFDTVNSVPTFENAWMQRSKFPYTARSSAKVIRHAVAIDERRAKFRQDLISQDKPDRSKYYKRKHKRNLASEDNAYHEEQCGKYQGRRFSRKEDRRDTLTVPERYRHQSEATGVLTRSRSQVSEQDGLSSTATSISNFSLDAIQNMQSDSDDETEQDISEVWFAGCHADIGGGWPLGPGENSTLSHVPLVWMVREAQRAGLNFDDEKLRSLHCISHEEPLFDKIETEMQENALNLVPTIEIDPASPTPKLDRDHLPPDQAFTLDETTKEPHFDNDTWLGDTSEHNHHRHYRHHHNHHHHLSSKFHAHLHTSAISGKIHDVLCFRNGASSLSVLSWNIMEFLPFRRMDLQEDGSWKSIAWPLPKGEVRDIPANAVIHHSVIKRMENDADYRPGNLIVGGGGRGVRKAPKEMGIGKWLVYKEQGDPIGECFVRKEKPERMKSIHDNEEPVSTGVNGPLGMFHFGK